MKLGQLLQSLGFKAAFPNSPYLQMVFGNFMVENRSTTCSVLYSWQTGHALLFIPYTTDETVRPEDVSYLEERIKHIIVMEALDDGMGTSTEA